MSHIAAQLFDIHVPIYLGNSHADTRTHPPVDPMLMVIRMMMLMLYHISDIRYILLNHVVFCHLILSHHVTSHHKINNDENH